MLVSQSVLTSNPLYREVLMIRGRDGSEGRAKPRSLALRCPKQVSNMSGFAWKSLGPQFIRLAHEILSTRVDRLKP